MKENTEYYNLIKPSSTDFYRVEDQNENMEVIDKILKKLYNEKLDKSGGVVSGDLKVKTINGQQIQTDFTDRTSGALMGVGAFGWGAESAVELNENPDNISYSSIYKIPTHKVEEYGMPTNAGGVLLTKAYSQAEIGYTVQEYTTVIGEHTRVFVRHKDSGEWRRWQELTISFRGRITVDNSSWIKGSYGGDYSYRKSVLITGVTGEDTVGFYPILASKLIAQDANVSHIESYNGGIHLYSESIPTGSIVFDYRIIRG